MKRKITLVCVRLRIVFKQALFLVKTFLSPIYESRVAKKIRRAFARLSFFAKISIVLVLVAIAGIASYYYIQNQRYHLSPAEVSLLSHSSVDTKYITEDKNAITYNRTTEQKAKGSDVVLAAAAADSTGKQPYKAVLSKQSSKGITFSDSAGDLSFTMTPNFTMSSGRSQEGRVVYPEGRNTSHVYTFKRNGIKEDIILSKAPGDTYTKSWTLNLGNKLEARLEANGSVGIYSANPYLFGNVDASSQADKNLVANAQKNGKKEYLAFVIPAPYLQTSSGGKNFADVHFKLTGNVLTIKATNLKNQSYPISIDPTIVITTTADFASGMDDGMIDYTSANQISRADVSYGAPGVSTQQTSAFTLGRYGHTSVVTNGFLYIIGGNTGSFQNDVQYCPLNSNGSVGTCTRQTNAFTTARDYHTSVVYNGYLYIIGGENGSYLNDIQYCPLNSNGSVGTCTQQTNAFTTGRQGHTSVAYKGYLYIIGGSGNSGYMSDIQYCPLNANGSVGTCTQQTSAFTTGRSGHASVVFNGYLYIIGGLNGSSLNDIQYCPLNSNGSVGTCTQQTSAFTTARSGEVALVSNGYLYIGGGYSGSYLNDIQYCPLNSNGSVGTCTQQTSAFTSGRGDFSAVFSGGYLYIIGGANLGGNLNDIQYMLLGKKGSVAVGTQQTSALTTPRFGHASVVYNGYLYIIGGFQSSTYYNDIQYCPLNANGSIGTCTQQTNAFTTARRFHASVAYNGYLYIIGGAAASSTGACTLSTRCNDIQYCPFNSNGSVGTCTQQLAAFTSARSRPTSVVYNGNLYIVGGQSNAFPTGCSGTSSYCDDIQYCPFNSNGSVGTCTQQLAAFTSARDSFASAVANGYLYIIGGEAAPNATGCNSIGNCNDIQYCPINTNGSIGACTQQTNAFTSARNGHTSFIQNGNLYIVGGQANSTPTGCNNFGSYCDDVQHCPISSNGAVGSCVQQLKALFSARGAHSTVVYNDYLYVVGGYDGTSAHDDILYQKIIGGDIGAVGTATQQSGAFTTARYDYGAVAAMGYLYIIGGYDGTSYLNDIQYCQLNTNGSVGTCTQVTNAFTGARRGHSVAVYNDYIYIIGGYDGTSYLSDVVRCQITNVTGTVGTCTQQTARLTSARAYTSATMDYHYLYVSGGYDGTNYLSGTQSCALSTGGAGSVSACTTADSSSPTARAYQTTVVRNHVLYIIGGYNSVSGGTYYNDITACPVLSNGSLNSCTRQTNAFNGARRSLSAAVFNDNIYITGGYDGANNLSDTQYCPIASNGSVGGCTIQANTFTSPRYGHGTVASNGYLYIIGGYDGTSYYNDIQYLKIGDRGFGSVGATTQQAGAFTTVRGEHTSVVYNGYLYIIGGYSAGVLNDITYCSLNTNGSVGTCTSQANLLSTGRTNHASVAYNGYIYLIGGCSTATANGSCSSGGTNLDSIEYCSLNSNGSVGTCTLQSAAFTTARYSPSAVVYNRYLYIFAGLGGGGVQTDMQYCPLNSNGSVGTCTQQTGKLVSGRRYQSAAIYNGYIYIIGGLDGSNLRTNDIQYCPINSDASVGTCILQSSAYISPRMDQATIAANGFLYITGGDFMGSNAPTNDIQYCPLNTNGSVGMCTQQTSALTTTRRTHTSVIYNGYLYMVGGITTPTASLNSIEYAKINTPQNKANYERLIDIGGEAPSLTSLSYNGDTKCDAVLDYRTADSTGVLGATTTILGAREGTTYAISQTSKRYVWVRVSLDDSTCGSTSNISDITLTYTSQPNPPTLIAPAAAATNVITMPTFQLRATDVNNDYIRYKIEICSIADCSVVVQTLDQTASQSGWFGQDAQSATAYIGASIITSSTIASHNLITSLQTSTQYWWRAYAIDPGGDNAFSAASTIATFTTGVPEVRITGGTEIRGGTNLTN